MWAGRDCSLPLCLTFSPSEAVTLLCSYPPGSRAGLLGCLQPRCTLAHSSSTSARLLSGLLEHCTRKQIPRKQTLSLGNWNAVGSNKQTLCNEDLGLCSCQQVQQVLHIKSSLDLLAPKREMPQRSCHLRFHISPSFPACHHPPPLSLLLARMYFHPLLISEEHIPLLSNWNCQAPNALCGKGRWGAAASLQGSGNPSPSAGVSAAQLSRSQSDMAPGQDAALEEHTWAVCTPQATGNPLWVIPPQTPGAGPYLHGLLTLPQPTWESSPEQQDHCLQRTLVHFNLDTLLSLSLNTAAVNDIYWRQHKRWKSSFKCLFSWWSCSLGCLCKWNSMNQPNMAVSGLQDHNTMPKYHLLLPWALSWKVFSFCKQLLVYFILRCCTM